MMVAYRFWFLKIRNNWWLFRRTFKIWKIWSGVHSDYHHIKLYLCRFIVRCICLDSLGASQNLRHPERLYSHLQASQSSPKSSCHGNSCGSLSLIPPLQYSPPKIRTKAPAPVHLSCLARRPSCLFIVSTEPLYRSSTYFPWFWQLESHRIPY